MTPDLTEEEMRQALFGAVAADPQTLGTRKVVEQRVVPATLDSAKPKGKGTTTLVPKLKVTLRVGNVFEGRTEVITYEANTLSTLQAELDATKAARKKYKYIEVISVIPMK